MMIVTPEISIVRRQRQAADAEFFDAECVVAVEFNPEHGAVNDGSEGFAATGLVDDHVSCFAVVGFAPCRHGGDIPFVVGIPHEDEVAGINGPEPPKRCGSANAAADLHTLLAVHHGTGFDDHHGGVAPGLAGAAPKQRKREKQEQAQAGHGSRDGEERCILREEGMHGRGAVFEPMQEPIRRPWAVTHCMGKAGLSQKGRLLDRATHLHGTCQSSTQQ